MLSVSQSNLENLRSMSKYNNLWGIVWLIVALVSMVAVIFGHHHQVLGVIIGTLMMVACGEEEEQSNNE